MLRHLRQRAPPPPLGAHLLPPLGIELAPELLGVVTAHAITSLKQR